MMMNKQAISMQDSIYKITFVCTQKGGLYPMLWNYLTKIEFEREKDREIEIWAEIRNLYMRGYNMYFLG